MSREALSAVEARKGLRVYRVPPEGFDVLEATSRQLAVYGVPRPPSKKTHPQLAGLWERHAGDVREWVVPELRDARRFIRQGAYKLNAGDLPPADLPLISRAVWNKGLSDGIRLELRNLSPQTSTNWSGAYASRPASEPFTTITGLYNVPFVQPPPSAWNGRGWNDGTYQAATWVGLDGWNGPDVLQAGVYGVATVKKGALSTSCSAWVEFWPAPPVFLSNYTVSPGDMLLLTVCAVSPTHGVAAFSNKTTGQATMAGFDSSGTTIETGVVAEWIVEFATAAGTSFGNYGSVSFHSCVAGTKTHEANLLSATPINMVDGSGSIVSKSELDTPTELQCSYI
jgi:hypothetical protein